jgi:hypothetical protein
MESLPEIRSRDLEAENQYKENEIQLGVEETIITDEEFSKIENKFEQVRERPTDCKNITSESQIFVDKSMFIKEFIQSYYRTPLFITRPTKWGKSWNMQMLKMFLEMKIKADGEIDMEVQQKRIKQFRTTKIGSEKIIKFDKEKSVLKYVGKVPIIFIRYPVKKANSIEEVNQLFSESVMNMYLEYDQFLRFKIKEKLKVFQADLQWEESYNNKS